jgi:hypothetical protein
MGAHSMQSSFSLPRPEFVCGGNEPDYKKQIKQTLDFDGL